MNKDQVKGRIDQATGKVKEEAGDLMNDRKLEEKGRLEKNLGKGRAAVGDLKDRVAKKIDK